MTDELVVYLERASTDEWLCDLCGAVVGDRDRHDAFHGRVVEDDWFGLNSDEIRADEYIRGDGECSVKLVHLPTGVCASASGRKRRHVHALVREKLAADLRLRKGA